jgi:plastocyanin
MKTPIIVIIVAILAIGGWYLYSQGKATPAIPSGQTQTNQNPQGPDYTPPADTGATGNSLFPMSATVMLTNAGFSPASITVAKGGTVTWVDQSGAPMWVASAVHPSHTSYDDSSRSEHCTPGYSGPVPFDQCKEETTHYSFTFNEAGTWNYHNHVSASETGTVIVQ